MKLRIRDNSLRFRLTRSEVDMLRDERLVSATVTFPGGTNIEYSVESSSANEELMPNYTNNRINVRIPESVVNKWADMEQVSISSTATLDGDDELALLIEKDFACLTEREGEDESDMFAHPNEGQDNC